MSSVKETLEVVKAIQLIGTDVKKALKDGKLNAEDLPLVLDLVKNSQILIDAVEGVNLIGEEVKELDQAELIELGSALFMAVKAIKEA